ncbi:sugar transferase [Streptomyces sp. NPDC004546]|uniref:sugar transferase n=1 Tax=unclassified Streptomyces TaxID=2593676 RepID=UPI0033B272D4
MLMKRLVDVVGSLTLLLLTAPVTFVICVAIITTSPGGVIFRQARAGRDGVPFMMFKFRTMRAGADAERATLEARNETNGHLFKVREDPRITPVGRLLRRLSLDELPQLFNVLCGEMSLVGPRPLPVADSGYTGQARIRLSVLPGLTGLWQIGGRSELPWEEMVRLDTHYVEHRSLALDLAILARTIPAVLTARGAH